MKIKRIKTDKLKEGTKIAPIMAFTFLGFMLIGMCALFIDVISGLILLCISLTGIVISITMDIYLRIMLEIRYPLNTIKNVNDRYKK